MLEKECARCKEVKPVTCFRPRSGSQKHLLRSWCLACEALNQAKRRDKLVQQGLRPPPKYRWGSDIPEAERRKYNKIKNRYGLSREDYEDLLRKQEHRCATCRKEFNIVSPHVDHCHETGKVRGLLCRACNSALGFALDDPKILQALIDYLKDQRTEEGND